MLQQGKLVVSDPESGVVWSLRIAVFLWGLFLPSHFALMVSQKLVEPAAFTPWNLEHFSILAAWSQQPHTLTQFIGTTHYVAIINHFHAGLGSPLNWPIWAKLWKKSKCVYLSHQCAEMWVYHVCKVNPKFLDNGRHGIGVTGHPKMDENCANCSNILWTVVHVDSWCNTSITCAKVYVQYH